MSDIAEEHVETNDDAVELTDEQLDAEFDNDEDAPDGQDGNDNLDQDDNKNVLSLDDDDDDDDDDRSLKEENKANDQDDVPKKTETPFKQPGNTQVTEPQAQTEEEKQAAAQAETEAANAARESFVSDMMTKLNDIEIGDGGDEDAPMPTTLGEFAEQFPEIANATKAMVAHLREELLQNVNPIKQMIETQQVSAARESLFNELGSEYGHDDAADIINSDAYDQWLSGKSQAYQNYVDSVSDANEAASVLSQFKSETGGGTKTDAQNTADSQRKAKSQRDKLHSATTRSRKTVAKKDGQGDSEADLDALFNEDDD